MSDFSGQVTGTPIQLIVQDQPSAQSGAEGKEDHVPIPVSRPPVPFGKGAGVRIVLEKTPDTGFFLEYPDNRNIVPARKVWRRKDKTLVAVERAAAADTDGKDLVPSDFSFADKTLDRRRNPSNNRFSIALSIKLVLFFQGSVERPEGDGRLGAADIHTDGIG